MKTLIVEDDVPSKIALEALLEPYGTCEFASNGKEALSAFDSALECKSPYDLICLDINMPELSGREALERIRGKEQELGIIDSERVKIIMTTASGDTQNVLGSFKDGCQAYLTKPIEQEALARELVKLGLIDAYDWTTSA